MNDDKNDAAQPSGPRDGVPAALRNAADPGRWVAPGEGSLNSMTQRPVTRMLRHLFQRAWPVLLILGLAAGLGASLGSAGCSNKGGLVTVSVDGSNPDLVIRAYFDAWQRGDWTGQAKRMDEKYQGMVPEPVESMRVLAIRPLDGSSATRREYVVSFEIKVKGQGVSMKSGRYDWSYELTWDEQRRSWLITNYGAG